MNNILTDYQLSEITLGALYFIPIYIIGSYIINGKFMPMDVIVTVILFLIWLLITKLATNYFLYNSVN